MCDLNLEMISQNLHTIILPNTFWTTQIHPDFAYISFIKLAPPGQTLLIEKAVVLTTDNKVLIISFYLNNNLVSIPEFDLTIIDVPCISRIILSMDLLDYCHGGSPTCKQYLIPGSQRKVCASCQDEEEFFLDNFITNIAPEDEIFKCTECGIILDNKADFRKHNLSHQEKVYLCHICGAFYPERYSIEEHLATHTDDKPYECNVCYKMLASKRVLKEHKRLHSGDNSVICSQCGETFKTRSKLYIHKATHNNVKKEHVCKECGKGFLFPSLLHVHQRIHTGEKPYACTVCKKKFSKNVHLTVHMRVHTGEKPFKCPTCPKTFSTSGNMQKHKCGTERVQKVTSRPKETKKKRLPNVTKKKKKKG